MIGIDIGARGIAYTVVDGDGKLLDGEVIDLLQSNNYNKTNALVIADRILIWLKKYIMPQIEKRRPLIVAIERPFKGKMAIPFGTLYGVLQFYCQDIGTQIIGVMPGVYKKKLAICRGNYDGNKLAAIAFMMSRELTNIENYQFENQKHKGDFADAYCLAVYVVNNLLTPNDGISRKRKRSN